MNGLFIEQDYSAYTAIQHDTWRRLFQRRMEELREQACLTYLQGLDVIGLGDGHLPCLADINARLSPVTGWRSRAVPGYIAADDFFACLSRREFPTTITIRPPEQLDYLPEPDIFHDIFGHVPMHADRVFGDFLQHFGQVAVAAGSPERVAELQRLFWFTVEFGLVRENGRIRIYGSGLISSPGEGRHCLESPEVVRAKFDLDTVIAQSFEIDHYQPILFVVDSFQQLYDSMEEYRRRFLS